MEKRRIRLEINGVVCGLITQESEEYMSSLADEVGEMMKGVLDASPFVTREAAALTAALSYCDDAKKNGKKAFELQERVDELEVEAELWQEEKAEMEKNPAAGNSGLTERIQKLEKENTALEEAAQAVGTLREKNLSLEDENSALQERLAALEAESEALRQAGDSDGRAEEYRSRLEALEQENWALKEAVSRSQAEQPSGEEISRLEEENRALKARAEEQEALAQKAEREKLAAVSAAKRAVEEARKMVDQAQAEAEEAKTQAKEAQKRAAPALETLERMAQDAPAKGEAPGETDQGAREPRRKRKNPLRYEEDFEQEGFVSFFEKKVR